MFHALPKICLLIFLMFAPTRAHAMGKEDDELVFDDEEKPKNEEGQEEDLAKPAPVPQRVEQVSDEQGLLRSMDEYDAHLPYEKLRKDVPNFHFDAAAGPVVGISGLSSHVGPGIRLSGIWRTWRYFGWGAAFDTQFLMGEGVSRPGFAPALVLKFFIPLKRRHDLGPRESWEIGLDLAGGYITQGLVREDLKWIAEGVHLRAGVDFSYWYTDYMRLFGRLEFAAPFWTDLCEESSAIRHCEIRERFDGKTLAFLAGIGFVIW